MKRQSKEKMNEKSSQHGLRVEKLSDAIYIHLDLTLDILSKLPLKSLARFQCVSKLWSSLITDSIKTRSLTQPRLLVTFNFRPWIDSTHTFSSAYPLNPTKTFISADKQNPTLTHGLNFNNMYRYVRGLICCLSKSNEFAIYNPTTRQSLVLPGIKYDTLGYTMDGFFGYDPVEDQYKVLSCVKTSCFGERSCQVFILGSPKKQQWRNINSRESFPRRDGPTSSVCINGIIYYLRESYGSVLGTFDVRFERFGHITMPRSELWMSSTLINYQGKLGCICCYGSRNDGLEMWILEDYHREKQEWSKIELSMPPYLRRRLHYKGICIAGVSRNGEIVVMLEKLNPDETLYAYFHDPKQNETRRVDLENTLKETVKYPRGCCMVCEADHVENTMDLFRIQVKKKPATRLPFSKKQLLAIAFFFAVLGWLAIAFRSSGLMSLLNSVLQ